MGVDLAVHDLRFEEDNWEAPTLGAWGVGWQVMLDGMEITQFTYFQQAGRPRARSRSRPRSPTASSASPCSSGSRSRSTTSTGCPAACDYGQVRHQDEFELSKYYFEIADVGVPAAASSTASSSEARRCLEAGLVLPAYECALKCSHLLQRARRPRRGLGDRAGRPDEAGARPGDRLRARSTWRAASGWVSRCSPKPRRGPARADRSSRAASSCSRCGPRRSRRACCRAPTRELAHAALRGADGARPRPARDRDRLHAAAAGAGPARACRRARRTARSRSIGPPRQRRLRRRRGDRGGRGLRAKLGVAVEALRSVQGKRAGDRRDRQAREAPSARAEGELPRSRAASRRPADRRRCWPSSCRGSCARSPWAKTMRWGSGDRALGAAGARRRLAARRRGRALRALRRRRRARRRAGHPVLSPEPFEVAAPTTTGAQLARARHRGPLRRSGASALGERCARAPRRSAARLVEDRRLLDKLAAICEIPGVMEGSFDAACLDLPREVLATSLRDHQSALTVENGDGAPAAGLPHRHGPARRPAGPRARRQRVGGRGAPRRRPLLLRRGPQAQTLAERRRAARASHVPREARAATPPRPAPWRRSPARSGDALGCGRRSEPRRGGRSALLKVDLTTEMVQGVHLAPGRDGRHLRARGGAARGGLAGDLRSVPARPDRRPAAARPDRADRRRSPTGSTRWSAFFGLGLVPTGSKDPFGLRRAAQGVVRMLLEGGLRPRTSSR